MKALSPRDLAQYLARNQGTEALRELRESLVAEGIPLDRARPTPGLRQTPPDSMDPRESLRQELSWVVGSRQYDLGTAPAFVAGAAARALGRKAEGSDQLSREAVIETLGPSGGRLFDLAARELESRRRPAPKQARSADRDRLPPNAKGAHRRSPDVGALRIDPQVIRRIPFRMRVTDLNAFAKLRQAIDARSERRDPANRIGALMDEPLVPSPKIAALDALRAEAAATKPLAGSKLLVLQHLYASTQSILDAAVEAGVEPGDVTVLGKPYSGSIEVAASMLKKGYGLVVPSLHQSEFADHERHMEALILEELTELVKTPGDGKLLVVDDGGMVAKLVAERFPAHQHRFRFVEQTQRGANTVREAHGVTAPVVNVAESFAKKDYESPSIAHSVFVEVQKVVARLESEGVEVPRTACVLGYGAIGASVAAELRAAGCQVHVYDPDPVRRARAAADGLTAHASKEEALPHGHMLIGASGREALALNDYAHLPQRSVLFNAASANNELNATNQLVLSLLSANAFTGTVQITGEGAKIPRELLFGLDTATLDEEGRLWDLFGGKSVCLGADVSATQIDRVVHTEDGKDLFFAHAGFVINLTDDQDPIPPRYIGLTRSLLFAGLLQAAGETGQGLVDLDPDVQQRIVELTEAELEKTGESLLEPRF